MYIPYNNKVYCWVLNLKRICLFIIITSIKTWRICPFIVIVNTLNVNYLLSTCFAIHIFL